MLATLEESALGGSGKQNEYAGCFGGFRTEPPPVEEGGWRFHPSSLLEPTSPAFPSYQLLVTDDQ